MISIDVALIQTSPPDSSGNMCLGVSVDIVKAAVETASLVVAQINSNMPFVYGDGIINIRDVDFLLPHDEPLLEYQDLVPGDVAQRLGRYVARLVEDGSTLQVGYGSVPNAVLANLSGKKHLGLHSELFSDGVAELMNPGPWITLKRASIEVRLWPPSVWEGRRPTTILTGTRRSSSGPSTTPTTFSI